MPFDRFLIAPINTGLQTDLRPWLIPDDAFTLLENSYVFRGRIRKRFGSRYMGLTQYSSRLRINIGSTDAMGNFAGTVPGAIFKVGQLFTIGGDVFTVDVTGTPGVMLTNGAATVHTYNTTTGAVVINGSFPLTIVYFYPAEPVMGIWIYEKGIINDQPTYAFDTQFAYTFNGVAWDRSGSGVSPIWHGNNLNFYWTANWQGATPNVTAFFVSNFQVTNPNGAGVATDDPLWETQDGTTWTKFIPYFLPNGGAVQTGPFVETALMIVPFKNRLVLFNTIENDNGGGLGTNSAFPQRARYSFNGSPFAVNAWYEPNQTDAAGNFAGGAGFIDAPTEEQIISSEFIKDRLIVFFERSTWEFVYTGNELLPFVWQKINTELGTEATFSTVPFDKVVLTVGNVGVHACNGVNVERIDNKIPDDIFQIKNINQDTRRIYGIRDYYTELVYWTFPFNINSAIYPNKVLVFNYKNGSWAKFDDSITVFGYFEQQPTNFWTWAGTDIPWQDLDIPWDSGFIEAQFRQILAGNQEGYVFIVAPDETRNAGVLQITNMANNGTNVDLLIVDHNLFPGEFLLLENTNTGLDGEIFMVLSASTVTNIVKIADAHILATYEGGGTAARVSRIFIQSKQWNPYVDQSRNFHLQKIDFCVLATAEGEVTVDYNPNSTPISMVAAGGPHGTNMVMGNSVLETKPYSPIYYPLEEFQRRLWHPVYFQTTGEFIQIDILLSDTQMRNPLISLEDFQLEGMILWCLPTSQRLE